MLGLDKRYQGIAELVMYDVMWGWCINAVWWGGIVMHDLRCCRAGACMMLCTLMMHGVNDVACGVVSIVCGVVSTGVLLVWWCGGVVV
jgi:hypothetical protein